MLIGSVEHALSKIANHTTNTLQVRECDDTVSKIGDMVQTLG